MILRGEGSADPLKIKGRQFAAEKQGSPKATMQGDDKGEGVSRRTVEADEPFSL